MFDVGETGIASLSRGQSFPSGFRRRACLYSLILL